MRFKLDASAFVIIGCYTFSFVLRLIIWSLVMMEVSQKEDLQFVLELLISCKAGVVSATLYYFVLEMVPIKVIIECKSFECYKKKI